MIYTFNLHFIYEFEVHSCKFSMETGVSDVFIRIEIICVLLFIFILTKLYTLIDVVILRKLNTNNHTNVMTFNGVSELALTCKSINMLIIGWTQSMWLFVHIKSGINESAFQLNVYFWYDLSGWMYLVGYSMKYIMICDKIYW